MQALTFHLIFRFGQWFQYDDMTAYDILDLIIIIFNSL